MEADPLPESQAVPEGWQLGRESWGFHRQFYLRVGRPAAHREYSEILWAIRRGKGEQIEPFHWRISLADGAAIVVCGGRQRLSGVEPADWTKPPPAEPPPPRPPRVWQVLPGPPPKQQHAAPKPPPATKPPPPPAPPPPPLAAAPPPRRPLGPSTLTLGSAAAKKALAERLQRMGVQAPP